MRDIRIQRTPEDLCGLEGYQD